MNKFIRDILTEDDGVSWCGAKVAAFVSLVGYLGNATYMIFASHATDFSALGTGLGIVLSGAGALIAGKQATQQKAPPKQD